jgi:hypothetical protein
LCIGAGAKAQLDFVADAARLKSCPDTSCFSVEFPAGQGAPLPLGFLGWLLEGVEMDLLGSALAALGSVLLPVAAGLLFEELTWGGLVRLLLAPRPETGEHGTLRGRDLPRGRNGKSTPTGMEAGHARIKAVVDDRRSAVARLRGRISTLRALAAHQGGARKGR